MFSARATPGRGGVGRKRSPSSDEAVSAQGVAAGVAGPGEEDELVEDGGEGEAFGFPEHGEHRDGGEAGHGVDLVDDDLVVGLEEEVDAGQAFDAEGMVGRTGDALRVGELGGGEVGGRDGLGGAEDVLVVVVVELAAGEDLAGLGDADVLVPEGAELELPAADVLLEDDVVVKLEGGGDGVADGGRVGGLDDADGGAEVGGLDEEREAQRGGGFLEEVAGPGGAVGDAPGGDGEAVVVEDRLGDALVHADGGGENAGADVGDAERLEVALDDAVLAEGAVQHGEDDRIGGGRREAGGETVEQRVGEVAEEVVGRREGAVGVAGRDVDEYGAGVDPYLVVGQADRGDGPAAVQRGLHDAARRDARHFVLGGRTPVDDGQLSGAGFWHRPRLYNRPSRTIACASRHLSSRTGSAARSSAPTSRSTAPASTRGPWWPDSCSCRSSRRGTGTGSSAPRSTRGLRRT